MASMKSEEDTQVATNQQRREAAKRKLERRLARQAEQARRRKIAGVILTVVVVLVAAGLAVVLGMSGNDEDGAAESPSDQSQSGEEDEVAIPSDPIAAPQRPEPLPDSVSCDYAEADDPEDPVSPPSGAEVSTQGTVPVTLHSTAGDIPVSLDRELAPCAVQNFAHLVEQDFYTDTSCHRLGTTDLQMLQCGDPTGAGDGGPGYTFDDEVFDELEYGRGILAMANSGPDTNGSQFFLVYGDAPLPPDYTVFGTIDDEGLAVLDEVARGGDDGSFEPNPGGGEPHVEVTFTETTIET